LIVCKKEFVEYLFDILRDAILSIGEDNVVQVVTDNASNCVLAGELLMENFPKLFWTPSVAHCIDPKLHDTGKIGWVQVNISQAIQMVKLILNHRLSLSIFRKYKTRNLLIHSDTRFSDANAAPPQPAGRKVHIHRIFSPTLA
jgi:hypothetical protein